VFYDIPTAKRKKSELAVAIISFYYFKTSENGHQKCAKMLLIGNEYPAFRIMSCFLVEE